MKIILAPDSFKGSLDANGVCRAMATGIQKITPDAEIVSVPLADGGEGTVDAFITASGGTVRTSRVVGPLGTPVEAQWGVLADGETAVIEMAAAAGLPLVETEKRNPLHTTTFGVGELITAALDTGAKRIIIGIGGSATNDCGAGMAQALGVKFFDRNGNEITANLTGEKIADVKSVSLAGCNPRLKNCDILVACDVTNPLLGPNGAAAVYGPQKGATPEIIRQLNQNSEQFIKIVEKEMSRTVQDIPGSGAAGGLGAGLLAFAGASLLPGIELLLNAADFAAKIRNADLVLTGEGRIDAQTAFGKTISGVLKYAKVEKLPVIAFGGSIAEDLSPLYEAGLTAAFSICPGPISLEQAMANSEKLIAAATEQVMRLFVLNN